MRFSLEDWSPSVALGWIAGAIRKEKVRSNLSCVTALRIKMEETLNDFFDLEPKIVSRSAGEIFDSCKDGNRYFDIFRLDGRKLVREEMKPEEFMESVDGNLFVIAIECDSDDSVAFDPRRIKKIEVSN